MNMGYQQLNVATLGVDDPEGTAFEDRSRMCLTKRYAGCGISYTSDVLVMIGTVRERSFMKEFRA